MTSVVVLPGRLPGVQPSKRLSFTPRVAPFGPQALTGMTPAFATGSYAPCTAVGWGRSVTNKPPLRVKPPAAGPELPPSGLVPTVGVVVRNAFLGGARPGGG